MRFKVGDKVFVNNSGLRIYADLAGVIGEITEVNSTTASLVDFGDKPNGVWQQYLMSNEDLEHIKSESIAHTFVGRFLEHIGNTILAISKYL